MARIARGTPTPTPTVRGVGDVDGGWEEGVHDAAEGIWDKGGRVIDDEADETGGVGVGDSVGVDVWSDIKAELSLKPELLVQQVVFPPPQQKEPSVHLVSSLLLLDVPPFC